MKGFVIITISSVAHRLLRNLVKQNEIRLKKKVRGYHLLDWGGRACLIYIVLQIYMLKQNLRQEKNQK